jgi:hypothetical protein
MWPLGIFLLFATAAPPQQTSPDLAHVFQPKLLAMQYPQRTQILNLDKVTEENRSNTCFTMRSYFFRRQDGNAPVPAGMTTCTPASILQQRQVSPRPRVRFVPLGAQQDAPE